VRETWKKGIEGSAPSTQKRRGGSGKPDHQSWLNPPSCEKAQNRGTGGRFGIASNPQDTKRALVEAGEVNTVEGRLREFIRSKGSSGGVGNPGE